MLLPVIYAKSLIFLCAHSLVLANPVSGDLDAQGIPLDVTVTKGNPELIGVYDKRSPEVKPDLHGFSRRQMTKDQTEALRLHNVARQSKNLRPLSWDATLTANALSWAKEIARKDTMVHSSSSQRPNQGENLAYAWSTSPITNPITIGTKSWLAEAKDYHNEVIPNGDFAAYGHYTQCMWKTSTKVGIATAGNGKGGWYTVARYSPPGNYAGQKPY